jgi:integrase
MKRVKKLYLVQQPKAKILDLVPRLTPSNEVLAQRIRTLGTEVLLEDQRAAIATFEWVLQSSREITDVTARRYVNQIERFLEILQQCSLPGGVPGPVTLWHLAAPGVGIQILYQWRQGLQDEEYVEGTVFGEAYRQLERFFSEFLCRPGQIIDYSALNRLDRGVARQIEATVITERYSGIANPFTPLWRPRRKQRRPEPVPSFDEWLAVLDVLWRQKKAWHKKFPPKQLFPRLRTLAMILLQSATGVRPSELCLIKQGDLLPDRLRILHGAEKDRFPKNKYHDIYGNGLGRYRDVPFRFVPSALREKICSWPEALAQSKAIRMESERALFPGEFGAKEGCVSYEGYRRLFNLILLEISDTPSTRTILEPYVYKPSSDRSTWYFTAKPYLMRKIYATYRMDRCAEPGAFRELMQNMGWLNPGTVLHYDSPKQHDFSEMQDRLFSALREDKCDEGN